MSIFYGPALAMTHSSARLRTQNPDLNEYKSAKNQKQFSVPRNENREERYVLATDRADQSHFSEIPDEREGTARQRGP